MQDKYGSAVNLRGAKMDAQRCRFKSNVARAVFLSDRVACHRQLFLLHTLAIVMLCTGWWSYICLAQCSSAVC